MSSPSFDFARYFARVQSTPTWRQMQQGMADFAEVQPGQRVLDLGTGPGRLVDALRRQGVRAFGADADGAVIDKFRLLHPELPVVRSLAERLPFASASFDAALSGNLLFFLPDPTVALRQMVRVTRPGGWISIWNPSEQMSVSAAAAYVQRERERLDEFEQKHLVNWAGVAESNRRWDTADLAALFQAAGLAEFETKTTLGGLARYARGRVG